MPLDGMTGFRGAGAARWTAADDALLLEARALGFTWDGIAILLGRDVGASAIRARFDRVSEIEAENREAERIAARAKIRNCLRCGGRFQSQHAGNRMCDPCRDLALGASPMALYVSARDDL